MAETTSMPGPRPTMLKTALIVGVFVAVGGAVALLLGETSLMPVFVALGVVTALGERKRWKQAASRGDDAALSG